MQAHGTDDVAKGPVLVRADEGVLLFWCHACHHLHGVWVDAPSPKTGGIWTWNQDLFRPTIRPAIEIQSAPGLHFRCLSFITDGRIDYDSHCEHQYAGRQLRLAANPLNML